MARGYMYGITPDREIIGSPSLEEYDLYEHLGELGVDYVRMSENLPFEADNFLSVLRPYGVKTGIDALLKDENGNPVRWFESSKVARMKYFSKKLKRAKKSLSDMTLEQFAEYDPWDLRMDIKNTYGDMLYLEYLMPDMRGTDFLWDTVDGMLRGGYIKDGERYYITCTMLLH